jgi:hypothetical protein
MVRLAIHGRMQEQPLTVRMDPRVGTPVAALRQQFGVSMRLAQALRQDMEALEQVRTLRKDRPQDAQLAALEGSPEENRPWAKQEPPSLLPWAARLAAAYDLIQSTDAAPTPQALRAAEQLMKESAEVIARFRRMRQ